MRDPMGPMARLGLLPPPIPVAPVFESSPPVVVPTLMDVKKKRAPRRLGPKVSYALPDALGADMVYGAPVYGAPVVEPIAPIIRRSSLLVRCWETFRMWFKR